MPELVFLKLGGSVITDKSQPFTARLDVLARLGREIRRALECRPELRLVIGHGSGSFGHAVARQYGTQRGNVHERGWYGFAATALAAARLNQIVSDILFEQGVQLVSLQPSASARCQRGRLVHLEIDPLQRVLEAGLVPVVYGDVALDEAQDFTIVSTEQIFDYLARALPVTRVILAGVVDGVYQADPLRYPGARRYAEITPADWAAVETTIGGSHAPDVTGGMLSKVRSMLDLVQACPGVRVRLLSAEIPNQLTSALIDSQCELGTLIHAP